MSRILAPQRRLAMSAPMLIGLALFSGVSEAWAAQGEHSEEEPELPAGLKAAEGEATLPEGLRAADDEPALPAGLGGGQEEPALPSGLEGAGEASAGGQGSDEVSEPDETFDEGAQTGVFHGFVDMRAGSRVGERAHGAGATLGEARLQMAFSAETPGVAFGATVDFYYDPALGQYAVDFERGEGPIDARALYLVLSPGEHFDLKIGRQIVTWGTGDLVFINDLFPKDWTAFMIGRDIEYLKAPSDVARLSFYFDNIEIDAVLGPMHDADRFPDRRRLSSYDPLQGRIVGAASIPEVDYRDQPFEDVEMALRQRMTVGSWEAALYGYRGFYKSPAGYAFDGRGGIRTSPRAIFPQLAVYGGSLRGPLLGGIINVEGGHYISLDDVAGDDPLIVNGETRLVVGYEHELARNLTMGGQYYLEWMLEHDAYQRSLPPGTLAADERRHVMTTRLTWLGFQQTLRASLFAFFSPSDVDGHLRPHVQYAVDDVWRVETGANIFFGRDEHTFFGQLVENSNVWGGVRASF